MSSQSLHKFALVEDILSCLYQTGTYKIAGITLAAGVQLGSWLIQVPGASSTILDIQNPYARESTDRLLKEEDVLLLRDENSQTIPKYVSYEMAQLLAKAAYHRAYIICEKGFSAQQPLGFASTGSLSSTYDRRGNDEAYFCVFDGQRMIGRHLLLSKGVHSRRNEDLVVSWILLHTLIKAVKSRAILQIQPSLNNSDLLRTFQNNYAKLSEHTSKLLGENDECKWMPENIRFRSCTSWKHNHIAYEDLQHFLTQSNSHPSFILITPKFQIHNSVLAQSMDTKKQYHLCYEEGSFDTHYVDQPNSNLKTMLSSLGNLNQNVVVSGSFNPFHSGHEALGLAGYHYLYKRQKTNHNKNTNVFFELSVQNADKGTISKEKVMARINQTFQTLFTTIKQNTSVDNNRKNTSNADTSNTHTNSLILTAWSLSSNNSGNHDFDDWTLSNADACIGILLTRNAPLFSHKANLFQGSSFVIGSDTSARIVNPKYYSNSKQNMITLIEAMPCTFLVAGRKQIHSKKHQQNEGNQIICSKDKYITLDDQIQSGVIPSKLCHKFQSLQDFTRKDISSSELRAANNI